MVSHRYITLSYCNSSLTKKATKGSPQGGVLSPLLWNLTLNTFLQSLGIHSSFIQAFADDLVILIRGICKHTIRDLAQQHLDNINRWCRSKGLKLSGVKTTAVLFTNKRDNLLDRPLMVDGTTIHPVPSTVYLGVTLDSKLSWGPHIMNKCDSAAGNLHACKRAVGKTWGISPSGIKWIYNQVILPSVMYSSVVWHHSVEQKLYLKQRLDTIQRHAALQITRGLKSTPTANLEIMAGLQPISLKAQETAIKSALRLKLNGNWNSNYQYGPKGGSKSHAYSVDSSLKKIPLYSTSLQDNITSALVLDRRFSTRIDDRLTALRFIEQIGPQSWQLYTDGSKIGEFTGAGFCAIKDREEHERKSFNLGSLATVYQCELFAIHMASVWAFENLTLPSHLFFLSDSQAAIKALNSTQVNSGQVLDIITQLNRLGTIHRVEVRWVPGHEGIPGNERADELARQGSSQAPIGPEPFLPIPGNKLTKEVHNLMYKTHLRNYSKLNYSTKGKIPLTHYLQQHRYSLTKLTGAHYRWMTWLLTGHSPLAYFQYRANNFDSPDCQHCPGEQETSEHFLCECVGYMTIRLQVFGKFRLTIEDVSTSNINTIIKYVKLTKRFEQENLFG